MGEGDEMIDRMKSAGYGDALSKKEYYGFLKILCGIERIDHAMSVFAKMKDDGCKPGISTYDLLMGKLVAHGRVDKANALYKEAESNGVPVEPKAYKAHGRSKEEHVCFQHHTLDLRVADFWKEANILGQLQCYYITQKG